MERCTLSLCVHSAELDSAANGAYCKIYVDANDMTHGSGLGHDMPSPDSSQASTARDSATPHGPRAFHTHVEKSDKKTYLPTWNETFTIDVYDRRNEILTIRLKSKKLLHVSVVGACAIPLRQISTGRPVDQWFPILKGGKRRGKLRLKMMIEYHAPPGYAGTPQQQPSFNRAAPPPPPMPQTPPQPATLMNHRHSGSRRSSGGSSFSSQQRRSSIGTPSPNPYAQQQQQQQEQQQYQANRPQATLATAAFGDRQPEAEPNKEQSPQRKETVDRMYRPPTNPRMDLESDDDDETSFPRVAELHRMESDLIGESSDEEIDEVSGMAPLSPLYMERLTEGGASHEDDERVTSPRSPRSSSSFERRSSAAARRSEHEQRHSVASASSQRQSIQQAKTRMSVDASVDATSSESSAASTDRRVSVEVARQTRVAVDPADLAHAVGRESFGVVDEILGTAVERVSDHSSRFSGSLRGSERENAPAQTAAPGVEVWSRYPSSSSSEETTTAYPELSFDGMIDRSSASSVGVDDEEEIVVHAQEVHEFVESASPAHSSHHEHEHADHVEERYSSSSEEMAAAYPELSFDGLVDRSSASSVGVENEKEMIVEAHEVNEFVEPASPAHSSHHEDEYADHAQERYDAATTPRGSISSDDEDRDEFFGTDRASGSAAAVQLQQSSPRTSLIDEEEEIMATPVRKTSSPRNSWVSDDAHVVANATATRKDSSPRGSWISEQVSEHEHGAQKTASVRGSWVSESDRGSVAARSSSRHDHSPRSSWVSEPADEVKPASARGSWVSESDRGSLPGGPVPRKDSSMRGSWVSESEGGSFVGEASSHAVSSPRHSWVSEAASAVAANARRESTSSWVSESDTASVVAGAARRQSVRSSWISEHDDESAPSPARSQVQSSRTSWVSEADSESVAAGTARRQSSQRTSWISEHDSGSAPSPARGRVLSSRTSWVSEHDSESAPSPARDRFLSSNSWISEYDDGSAPSPARDRFNSSNSWISEHDEGSAPSPARDRFNSSNSWISEHDEGSAPSPARDRFNSSNSWISEHDNTSFVSVSAASPRSSWISEEVGHEGERTSWVSEDPDARKASLTADEEAEAERRRQRTRTSSFRTSWISESPQTNSFVDASFLRHSFVSEGSVGDEDRERMDDDVAIMAMRESMEETISPREDIAILASPVRGATGATTPTRLSLVIENGDVDSETETADISSPNTVVQEGFMSERISSSSSERSVERSHVDATTPRGSVSSETGVVDGDVTHRQSSMSSRLSTEENTFSAAPRVSIVSGGRPNGSVSSEDFEESYTPRESLSSDVAAADEVRSDASASSTPRNSFERDMEDRFDNATTPRGSILSDDVDDDRDRATTTPRDSLSSAHAEERASEEVERLAAATTPRSSVSSRREDGYSSYAESYGESVTRDSSVSSFSADNYVDRDDPDQHAEAVADAARYSSSSEDEFENHDSRAKSSSSVDGKATPPRRYSSASEDDTVDRSSLAVVETFDNSHAIPRYSSSSQDTEVHSTTWGEGSSTNDELMDALRRQSQVSGVSDMYDLSPRSSEDVYDRNSQSHRSSSSVGVTSHEQFVPGSSEQVPDDLRRFISTVNVLVEPYNEDSPRSSTSNDLATSYTDTHTYTEDEDDVVEAVDLDELVEGVAVTLEAHEAVPTVNPFVEVHDGSARSSVSSVDGVVTAEASEAIAVAVEGVAVDGASARSSESSDDGDVNEVEERFQEPQIEISIRPKVAVVKDVAFVEQTAVEAAAAVVDEKVVIEETLTESSPLAVAAEQSLVEASPLVAAADQSVPEGSPISAAVDQPAVADVDAVVGVSSPHMVLDNIIATRDFIDDGELSPHSSLSSLSPRDSAYENLVDGESATQRRSSGSRRRSSTGGRRRRKSSQNVSFAASAESQAPSPQAPTTPKAPTPKAKASSSFSPIVTPPETSSSSAAEAAVNTGAERQNVRGDHVLLSAQSTLTRQQLSVVALDYLPSSDSESDDEAAFSSDADLNFDSD